MQNAVDLAWLILHNKSPVLRAVICYCYISPVDDLGFTHDDPGAFIVCQITLFMSVVSALITLLSAITVWRCFYRFPH